MAHRIERHDIQEGIEMAWHGLTQVRPVLTLDDCWLSKWDVQKHGLTVQNPQTGEYKQTPWTWLRCTDKPVWVGKPIGPSYGVIDNKTFLALVRDSIAGTPHKIVSCGSLRNRGRVFITVHLDKDHVTKVARREFMDYLTYGTSHDLSSELFTINSNVCTVCDNTYSMNLATARQTVDEDDGTMEDDSVDCRVRHTKHAIAKLPEIAKMIDKALGVRAEFYKALASLDAVKVKEQRAEAIFVGFESAPDAKDISGMTRTRVGELVNLFKRGKGNRGETMADVFSAVTDYYTHSHTRKDLWKQFESSEYGSGAAAKREMMATLTNETRLEKTVKRGESLLKASVSQFI